jgi:SAM-dependent methyltransferase
MPHAATDRLTDSQLESFDTEYVSDSRWQPIKACIDRDFPSGRFSFLDLGGGNGVFADRVLANYPNARGTVLDASELLLSKNTSSSRKRTVLGDAMTFAPAERYDIVFCNWLLHHLVTTGDYQATRRNIAGAIENAVRLLTPNGRLSIYENEYEGFIEGFPGRAIFEATSSKLLAGIFRRLGANTAGVGVSFLSHRQWVDVLRSVNAKLASYTPEAPWNVPTIRRIVFLLRSVRRGHYWIKPGH